MRCRLAIASASRALERSRPAASCYPHALALWSEIREAPGRDAPLRMRGELGGTAVRAADSMRRIRITSRREGQAGPDPPGIRDP